jgi:hypothetical protein
MIRSSQCYSVLFIIYFAGNAQKRSVERKKRSIP